MERMLTTRRISRWQFEAHSMNEVEKEFAVHEAVCAERYAAIEKAFTEGDKRMTRIEYLLYIVIGAVLLGPGFVGTVINKLIGA